MSFNLKILSIVFLSFLLYSCSSVDSGDTFMWRVDDGDSHIYLLGSIHIGKPEMYPLDERIEAAYKDCEIVAFELDLSKIDPIKLMEYMTLENGEALKDKISEENYNRLKKIFDDMGVPEMIYSRMKPWAAAITSQQMLLMNEGYDDAKGIDQYFLEKAQEDGKEIRELETAEFQLSLLQEFDKVGDSFIEFTIENTNESIDGVDLMVKAWKNGDKEELNNLLNKSRKDNPDLEAAFDRIVDERNDNMTAEVEKWLQDGKPVFVVVGAGHLVGESGIINQLRKKEKYKIVNY